MALLLKRLIGEHFAIVDETKRQARIGKPGDVVFEAEVTAPPSWSDTAVNIFSQKYMRVVNGQRETSVGQTIRRVVGTIAAAGVQQGYLDDSPESRAVFNDELTTILTHQLASFNSPVWFNVGVVTRPRSSACFINSVEDSMDSILDLAKTEGMIFKHGGGSGVNVTTLRSKGEQLSNGGTASGPVSFMRGWDAFAGVIKSGGSTRRAAKMVCLNIDHPDVEHFATCKSTEELKARALEQAGFSGGIEGEAATSVGFQNANHSIRVTDEFMRAVEHGESWTLRSPATGQNIKTVEAKDLFRTIADAAWRCGDPGVQFDTTINQWHTCPAAGPINASNPCAEFVFLDDSACNLASINLMRFCDGERFSVERFRHVVDLLILAQEIIVGMSSYPTERIARNTENFRPLGLGYTNLGAFLMTVGAPYDSVEGRGLASFLTALMHFRALRSSSRLAQHSGAFLGYQPNAMIGIVYKHFEALQVACEVYPVDMAGNANGQVRDMLTDLAKAAKSDALDAIEHGKVHGFRNAQVTVLAPTGTISFGMDCETTGIEPLLALTTTKTLIGGGTVIQTAECATRWIAERKTAREESAQRYIDQITQTALGQNVLTPEAHVEMMAAVQPFLSGAISKTVNMPAGATVVDVMSIYQLAWKLGLKSIAIYRNGCKISQPVVVGKQKEATPTKNPAKPEARTRLPSTRKSVTHKFEFGSVEGYLTVGLYEDGRPGEIFLRVAKEGSTLSGLLDAVALAASIGLQYGVPLDVLIQKFSHTRFEPSGWSAEKGIGFASSILDYIFRWISQEFPVGGVCAAPAPSAQLGDAPLCEVCGSTMVRAGSCHACKTCGTTGGCG